VEYIIVNTHTHTKMELDFRDMLDSPDFSEDFSSVRSGPEPSFDYGSEAGMTEINAALENHTAAAGRSPPGAAADRLRMRPESWNLGELHTQRLRLAMQNQLSLEREKHRAELDSLRREFDHKFARNLKATEEMQTMKENLRDFTISEALYRELKSTREEELSVREFVLIRVYELREGQKKQIEQLQQTRDALEAKVEELNHQRERLAASLEQKTTTLSSLQDDFNILKLESERRIDTLTQELKRKEEDISTMTEKSLKFDDCSADVERLRTSVDNLQLLTRDQSTQISQLSKEKIDLSEKLAYLEARKTILERENQEQLLSLEHVKSLSHKKGKENDNLEERLRCAKEKKRALATRIELEQTNSACEVRERVNLEIARLQEKMQGDLDAQKTTLIALHEKETQMNGRQVMELERQRSELQRRLDENEHAKGDLQLSSTKIQMELQNEITELRGLLKLRGFENDRFSIAYDEANTALQRTVLEKDKMNAKFELLRKEYYELEIRLKEDGAQDRATVIALQEQLDGYKKMETELDMCLRDVAENEPPKGTPTPQSVEDALILGTTLAGAPACTRRRIQESLILAQQLQRKTRESALALQKVKELEEQVELVNEQKSMLEKEKGWRNEPTNYLTESLRVREQELSDIRRAHKVLQREFENVREQCRKLEAAYKEVQEDLRSLLAQREQVNALQKISPYAASSLPTSGTPSPAGSVSIVPPHKVSPKGSTVGRLRPGVRGALEDRDMPQWFRKLKQKNGVV